MAFIAIDSHDKTWALILNAHQFTPYWMLVCLESGVKTVCVKAYICEAN